MDSLTDLLIVILVGIIGSFYLARIIRFFIGFLRYIFLSHKYKPDLSDYYNSKNNRTPPKFGNDDFQSRDKKQELKLATEIDYKKTGMKVAEKAKIVGIAEPIGKWTRHVTSQKISWLQAMVGSKVDSESFWQNMIKAQQKAASKHKGQAGPGS